MNRRVHILALVMVSIYGLAPIESASAQWNYRVNLNGSYDTNPLGLRDASSSAFLSASAGASYSGRSVGTGYNGLLTGYEQPTELSSYLHQAYLNLGNDRTGLYSVVEQRLGTQSALYDYSHFQSTLRHQFGCAEFQCTLTASAFVYQFSELIERNQRKIIPLLKLTRSFETRTSLIASVGAGYTYYTDLSAGDATAEDNDVTQFTFSIRLAQSLTPTTGGAAFYHQRMIHGATSMTFMDEESGVSYAILDDPSLYSTRALGVELTQMLKDFAVSVKIGGSFSYRDYPSQGIYLESGEYDTEVLREDHYSTIWMTAAWNIPSGGPRVSLNLAGQWSDNQSNSYWYDYSSSYLSVGLGVGL